MSEKTPLAFSSDESKFLTVANQLIAGIAQTDLAGRFVLVNDFFCAITGYPREELLDKTLFDITHPDDISPNFDLFRDCVAVGKPFTIEKRYIRKDGSAVWVRNSVSLLRDADGKAQFIIAVSNDISKERTAQTSLEKSDERYRDFITRSSEAIWRFELDAPVAVTLSPAEQIEHIYRHSYLAECNDAVARMYGYESSEEITGMRLPEFMPPTDAANTEYLRAFIESGYRLESAESHEVDRHGNPKFFLNNLVGVVENGFLLRVWGTQRDITGQKLIEQKIGESEERYRTVTETASDAILQIDESSVILFVNHAAERIFGYQTDELIGQSLTMLMPENLRERHRAGIQRYLETGSKKLSWESIEVPARHKDGRIFPLEISFGEFNEQGRRFFIGIARDVSARKQSEKVGAHLAAIVESSDDAIISKDLTSRITSWNKGAERIFGYLAKEVIGKSITILIPPELINEEARILENIRQGRRIEHFETVRRRKDGTEIYVSITVSPIRDRNGKIIGASKIARDITESKEIENDLRESQAMLALTMRSSRMGAWSRELTTDEVWWSDELEEIFGLPRGGFARTENGFYDLIHEDDRARVWAEVESAIAEKRDYIVEFRFLHADGSIRWMEGRGQAVYSDKGEPVRIYGIGIDITARKQAEGASKRFQILSERARDIIFLLHPDGTILEANAAAASIYGYTRDELIKLKIHDLRASSTLKTLDAQLAQANREGILFETVHRRKDGSTFPVEVNSSGAEIGGERLLLSVIRDITERKRAEEKLRNSENQLRVVTDAMPALISYIDAECRYRFVNKTYTDWFGHQGAEVIGRTMTEILGEAAFNLMRPHVEAALAGKPQLFETEVPYKDGKPRFIRATYTPDFAGDGSVKGFFVLVLDISDSKQAEEKLRESEEKYRTLFETIDEGFCIIEMIFDENEKPLDYRFVQANPAFERLTGLENAIGKTMLELVPDLEDFWFETYGKVALTGESVRFENNSQPMNRWFDVYASRIGDSTSRLVALVFNNITERKQAEEKLRESESTLRAFYASSPLMMGITEVFPNDVDVLHIYDNPATCAFFGLEPDAPANRTASQMGANEEVFKRWIKYYRESEKLGQPVSFENEQKIDGRSRWLATTVSCLGTASSGQTRFAYVSEDITEKKLAQEALIKAERRAAEEYLELLSRIVPLGQTLGTARDLISIYRSVGEFVRSSMPCSAFFVSFFDAENSLRIAAYVWGEGEEVDADALPPMPITEDGGPNSRAILGKQVVVTNKGYMDAMRNRPHVVLQDNGIEPDSSIVVPMIVMNRVVGTLEVQAHEAEAYNREHTVALEMVANLAAVAIDNVRLLQIEETARREAESANRAKDEFLSVVSHELRTPLNSMFGWTRMLKSGMLDETKQKQAVEVIERNVRLQNSLIEDLLDVSRIISGKMRIETEETDFATIVATTVEAARPLAEQKKISLVFETESASYPLQGDEVRLQQIVNNLINNAVKFTSEDGLVVLKLVSRNRSVVLQVTDTGIGIAPEFLPKIFDRFLQADSTTKRTHSGLGLGLTIVRHLTELHGGHVTASSEGLGKGATFTVELPLSESFSSETGADSALSSNGGNSSLKGSRILLVDDDLDAMMPLQIILESEQAEVACASSAFEALEKLAAGKFDLIVSDVGMPEMDGYDMITLLRRSDESPNREIPAIALTAYASAQDKQRALESGFQQHFAKPIDFDNFLASVTNFIRKKNKK